MAIAVVCAAFDAGGDAGVAAVRSLVRSLGGLAAASPAHRPHFTLSAAQVDDPGEIAPIAAEVATRHKPFRLALNTIGAFGQGDVVWLGPRRSARLEALQRDAYSSLLAAGYPPAFAGQSDPREWRPHCTIARRMPPDLLRRFEKRYRPFDVRVTGVAVVVVGAHGDAAYVPLAGR
jgi:2'-5' RNA ligase